VIEEKFKVPIRNVFYLLSYVNKMPELVNSKNALDEEMISLEFIAKKFLAESIKVHRRGLARNYKSIQEDTNRLSGRILMNESMYLIMTKKPLLVCQKDEYTADILLNSILKTTLLKLSQNYEVSKEVRVSCHQLAEMMENVSPIEIKRRDFEMVNLNRTTNYYNRAIQIARMIYELTLLMHTEGKWDLFNAEIEEASFHQIFEKFLLNFYNIEQNEYTVKPEILRWDLVGNVSLLPVMKTDVSMIHRTKNEKIIIDAKYYRNIFREYQNKRSLNSGHLYQLFGYLNHQPKNFNLKGILIYPTNGFEVHEVYQRKENMCISVQTVNLNNSWKDIHKELMNFVFPG